MSTWTFQDGVKVAGGRRVPLTRTKTYLSSDGNTIYTRSWWSDGTQSCNCPGWARRVDRRTGERTCGHVEGRYEDRAVDNERRVVGPSSGDFRGVKVAAPLRQVEMPAGRAVARRGEEV